MYLINLKLIIFGLTLLVIKAHETLVFGTGWDFFVSGENPAGYTEWSVDTARGAILHS